VVHLSSKLIVSFSPRDTQGLEDARATQLDEIEISPSGYGIYFPKLDADIYVPGLLEGLLGSKKWMLLGPVRLAVNQKQSSGTHKQRRIYAVILIGS